MAYLDESLLKRAFRARLKTVSNLPADQYLAWENQNFRPPEPDDGQPWIREHLRILNETKSTHCLIEAIGQIQYMVNIPTDKGTRAGDDLSRSIADAFEAGQSLNLSGLTIILERTERLPYILDQTDPVWTFKTVQTRWRVFTVSSTP